MPETINIQPLPIFNDNYIWVLVNSKVGEAVCVDPGDAMPLLSFLSEHNLTLKSILITHHHQDHIGGLQAIKASIPEAKIYGPNDVRLSNIDSYVYDGDNISLASFCPDFKVIATPGHTKSHLCYYSQSLNALFCGDTLFSAGCGRLFEGSPSEMYYSLQKILKLPESTRIFPTHEYTKNNLLFAKTLEPHNEEISIALAESHHKDCTLPTTLSKEKKINPFLRTQYYLRESHNLFNLNTAQHLDEITLFAHIRERKDRF